MLKKYPSRYIKIPVFLCLPPSFPRWHEVIRLPSSSPHITDYSDMFSESSVCSGLLSLRLSHFSFLTWLLSLLSVLPSLMNNSILLAKLLLSCLTLCNHMDHSLPGSSFHGILQARILEWVAISFSNAWKWEVKVKSLSRVRLFETPWTAAYQAPPSMGFSRQEYWSGVPLPEPAGIFALNYFLNKFIFHI